MLASETDLRCDWPLEAHHNFVHSINGWFMGCCERFRRRVA
jgi:hypothetical protein